jgi:ketosteroid isomerase-like protein
MSKENVELVRECFGSVVRGDWDQMAQFVDPEVEMHGTVGGLEERRILRGLPQIVDAFLTEDLEAWEERRLEPQEFLDAGENVVMLLHEYRRGKGSGVPLESDTGVVFAVRDGRILRIQGFMDPAAALEAAGLSE